MLVSNHAAQPTARLSDYLAIARPDHWIKHVLIIPGVAFAMIMSAAGPLDVAALAERLLTCLFVAMALSSANYTINEWLDAPFDAMHPTKRARPAVQTAMSPAIVFAQYILLTSVGMLAANTLGGSFSLVAVVFAIFGVIYNVRPIRAKDRAFLDVIVESLNNPLRFLFGWFAVTPARRAAGIDPARLLVRRRVPDGRQARLGASRHRRGRRHREPRRVSPVLRRLHAVEPGDELPRLRPGLCVHDGDLPVKIPDRISRRHSAASSRCLRPICGLP